MEHVVTRRVCRMIAGGERSGGECHCWANNFISYLHHNKSNMSGAIRLNGLVVEWGVILVLMTNETVKELMGFEGKRRGSSHGVSSLYKCTGTSLRLRT